MPQPLSPRVVELDGPFTHEYVHTRGIRLHAAVAGAVEAPLVVLLHDVLGGWFDYQRVIETLGTDFHVAAVSLRGFGLSDKPPHGYSLRYATGDISGLIRALGHGSAVVVADGSATRVASLLAANYPARVRGLVLIAQRSRLSTLALANLSSRFPHQVATNSLPSGAAELVELRSQAYQIGGTAGPRRAVARNAFRPKPMKWSREFSQPAIHLSALAQWLDPESLCDAVHRVS